MGMYTTFTTTNGDEIVTFPPSSPPSYKSILKVSKLANQLPSTCSKHTDQREEIHYFSSKKSKISTKQQLVNYYDSFLIDDHLRGYHCASHYGKITLFERMFPKIKKSYKTDRNIISYLMLRSFWSLAWKAWCKRKHYWESVHGWWT